MHVLGICGSLRRGSYNRMLLLAAARCLPRGWDFELLEGLDQIPPYNEDRDIVPAPATVSRLRNAIAAADALLIATPEYNASPPGALKNALDWASRPFPHNCLHAKPVAVVGASTGVFGAVWAQAELRKVLNATGATVIPSELPVATASRVFSDEGRVEDRTVAAALAAIVGELVAGISEQAA